MWALIDGTRVAQLENVPFQVHSNLHWIEVGPEITTRHRYVNGVFLDPEPDPAPPTPTELIDQYFPQSGVAHVLFEALFEIANRLQTLEGKPLITRAQLRDWLINKIS